MLKVGDIMDRTLETLDGACSALELRERLNATGHFAALVTGPRGPLGVVSRGDLATFVKHAWETGPPDELLRNTPLESLLAPFQYYTSEESSVWQLSEAMLRHGISRVVVMRGDQAVGAVSAADLVRGMRTGWLKAC